MSVVFDYAKVHRIMKRPDGSIGFYMRIAAADRDYRYINKDGSTRKERITKEQLFAPKSTDTLKFLSITNGHTRDEIPSTKNFKQVAVGMTGELVMAGIDGPFLGQYGNIKDEETIRLILNDKVNQVSPGYHRNLVVRDGILYQEDREYFEIAVVPLARGGPDIKIKDDSDWSRFDPSQIDEDLEKFWLRDDGFDSAAIDRLLLTGSLSPPPIYLPQLKTMSIKIKIGDTDLMVDESSVDAASQLKADVAQLKLDAAKATTQAQDGADAKAELAVLKMDNAALKERLAAVADSLPALIQDQAAQLANAQTEIKSFADRGLNVKDAQDKLAKHDLPGYKAAIVDAMHPGEVFTAAEANRQYSLLAKRLGDSNKDMNALYGMGAPGASGRSAFTVASIEETMASAATGTYQDIINGTGGWPTMLPPLVPGQNGVRTL